MNRQLFSNSAFFFLLLITSISFKSFPQERPSIVNLTNYQIENQKNEINNCHQATFPVDSNIVEISQLFLHGNLISDIWISGNTAYALSNFGLLIFDISNIASPRLIGYWGIQLSCTFEPRDVIIQGDYAYLVDRQAGFIIIDVSDKTRPMLSFFYELSGFSTGAVDIDIENELAFIAARQTGLLIFNISNPLTPQLIASHHILNDITQVEVEDTIAYIYDSSYGIVLIDVSNPINPVILSQFHTADYVTDYKIADNHVFATYLRNGVHIIDVSNPLNPQLVHDFQFGDYYDAIEVVDSTAYVIVNYPSAIQVFNVADPTHPFKINDYATEGTSLEMVIIDQIGYIADGPNGISIVDFSDPANFRLIGNFFPANGTKSLSYTAPYLYVAKEYDGLHILDIQNPAQPIIIGEFEMNDFIESMRIHNDILYVLFYNTTIQLYDISNNPLQPQFLSQIYLTADSDRFDTDGNYLYWAKNWRGVHIYNIIDKSNPRWISEIETRDKAYSVFIDSSLLYIADYEAGMEICDISNPYQPLLLGSYDSPGRGYDIVARENYAFLADDSGLEIINVENPAQPVALLRIDSLQKAQRLKLSGDRLYLSCRQYGFQIYDIANPMQPVLIGSYDTPGVVEEMINIGDIIYTADQTSLGLYQLNYDSGNIFSLSGLVRYYSNHVPLRNIEIKLSGTNHIQVDSTDEAGQFGFDNIKPGNYVIKPQTYMIDHQAISPYDASLILQSQVGLIELTPQEKIAADVSQNGKITAYDASYVLRYCVGLIDSFPGDKQIVFIAEQFPLNDSNWIQPCDSIICENLSQDRIDLDFSGVLIGDVSGNYLAPPTKSYHLLVELKQTKSNKVNGIRTSIPILLATNETFFSGRFDIQLNPGIKLINALPGKSLDRALYEMNIRKNALNLVFASNKKIPTDTEILTLIIDTSSDSLNLGEIIDDASLNMDERTATVIWSDDILQKNKTPASKKYELAQNYPNPFNNQTLIRFSISENTRVILEIYNISGQKIRTVLNDNLNTGSYSIQLNAHEFHSGIYFYRLQTEKIIEVKKMIVVR